MKSGIRWEPHDCWFFAKLTSVLSIEVSIPDQGGMSTPLMALLKHHLRMLPLAPRAMRPPTLDNGNQFRREWHRHSRSRWLRHQLLGNDPKQLRQTCPRTCGDAHRPRCTLQIPHRRQIDLVDD